MTSILPMRPQDLFTFNQVNLDKLTETYRLDFYFNYFSRTPEFLYHSVNLRGETTGYILGKAEGKGSEWRGHVSAVTVSPSFRRLGLARKLMAIMEDVSEKTHNCYFCDLFVRESNKVAIKMYHNLGYIIYTTVLGYYSGVPSIGEGGENALIMRKSLARDTTKHSMKPLGRDIQPSEIQEDF